MVVMRPMGGMRMASKLTKNTKLPRYVGGAIVVGTVTSTVFNISSLLPIEPGDMLFIIASKLSATGGTLTGGSNRNYISNTSTPAGGYPQGKWTRRINAGDLGASFTLTNTTTDTRIYIEIYRNVSGVYAIPTPVTTTGTTINSGAWTKETQAIGVRHAVFDNAAATLARPASLLPNLRFNDSGAFVDVSTADTLDLTTFPDGSNPQWTGLEGSVSTGVLDVYDLLKEPSIVFNRFVFTMRSNNVGPPAYNSIYVGSPGGTGSQMNLDVGDTLVVCGYESGAGPLNDPAGNPCSMITVNLGSIDVYVAWKVLTSADFSGTGEFRWMSPTNVAGMIWMGYKGFTNIAFKTKRDYTSTTPLDTATVTGFTKSNDHKGVLVLGRTGLPTGGFAANMPSSKWRGRASSQMNPVINDKGSAWFADTMGKNSYQEEDIVFSGFSYAGPSYRTVGLAAFELT